MARNNQNNSEVKVEVQERKTLGQQLYAVGEGIVIAIGLVLMVVLFYNPVMFLLWSIVTPKRAANMLYKFDVPIFMPAMRALNGWMICLYPFCMKKYFMAARGLSHYSVPLQIRYYKTRKECMAPKIAKAMSAEAIAYLWEHTDVPTVDRVNILRSGRKLTDQQVRNLIYGTDSWWHEVETYLQTWTPSVSVSEALLGAGKEHKEIRRIFLNCVETYGLPAELIEMSLNSDMSDDVQTALEHFAQRTFVHRTAGPSAAADFAAFCRKTDAICDKAQMAMNGWQYEAFHSAGHKLSTAAVEDFLQKGDMDICTKIFQYEENLSPLAKSLIHADPKLMSVWVRG